MQQRTSLNLTRSQDLVGVELTLLSATFLQASFAKPTMVWPDFSPPWHFSAQRVVARARPISVSQC